MLCKENKSYFVTKILTQYLQMDKIKVLDKKTPHETSWVPVVWAIRLLTSAHEDDKNLCRLESPVFANLLSAIDKIEANNRKLLNYGWVNFPLAYTQVPKKELYDKHIYFLSNNLSNKFYR